MSETEHARQIRKMIERLEAFRLACKQATAGTEEYEKFLKEELENGKHE